MHSVSGTKPPANRTYFERLLKRFEILVERGEAAVERLEQWQRHGDEIRAAAAACPVEEA